MYLNREGAMEYLVKEKWTNDRWHYDETAETSTCRSREYYEDQEDYEQYSKNDSKEGPEEATTTRS